MTNPPDTLQSGLSSSDGPDAGRLEASTSTPESRKPPETPALPEGVEVTTSSPKLPELEKLASSIDPVLGTADPTATSAGEVVKPSTMAGALMQPRMVMGVEIRPGQLPRKPRNLGQIVNGLDFDSLPRPGSTVGRYRVGRILGMGGMGVVYAAHDPELRRPLALKLVRFKAHASRADAAQQRERLLSEARALARLSHTNVISIFDTGVHQDNVYIVLEYIDGKPLDEWLRSQEPSWSDILDVYQQAARGLAAAHEAGLVHRDFKPSNVMLDGRGRVVVLDFGLAQDVEGYQMAISPDEDQADHLDEESQELGEHFFTRTGVLVGTPAFMSPEQFAGQKADSRSDQFSFCVALYHALYGRRPFSGRHLQQLMHSVMEDEPEPPPRTSGVPHRIWPVLLRGLAKDPAARFASMDELVRALVPRKPSRRRALGLGVLAAASAAAVTAFMMSSGQVDRCADAGSGVRATWTPEIAERIGRQFQATGLDYADVAWSAVRTHIASQVEQMAAERLDVCQARYVRHEQSANTHQLRGLCLDRAELRLRAALAQLSRADAVTVESSMALVAALPAAETCRDATRLQLGMAPPPEPAIAVMVDDIRSDLESVRAQRLSGHSQDALAGAREQLERARHLDHTPLLARALHELGAAQLATGDPELWPRAEARLLDAADLAETGRRDALVVDIWNTLTLLASQRRTRFDLGHVYARRAHAAGQRAAVPAAIRSISLRLRGNLFFRQEAYQQAEDFHRRALALVRDDEAPTMTTGEAWAMLAATLAAQSRYREAHEGYRQALAIHSAQLGDRHPRVASLQYDHGLFLRRQGRFDQAREALEKARDSWRETRGANHADVARAELSLANLAQEMGRLEEAERHLANARRIHASIGSSAPTEVADLDEMLGIIQFQRGRYEDAIASYERALAVWRHHLGEEHLDTLQTRANIGEARQELGQCRQAQAIFADLQDQLADSQARDLQAFVHLGHGRALACLQRPREARPWLQQALVWFRQNPGYPQGQASALWTLARTYHVSSGRMDPRARQFADEARNLYLEAGPLGATQAATIASWLREPTSIP